MNLTTFLTGFAGIITLGIYSVANTEANRDLHSRLITKLEMVADRDENEELDLAEITKVYETLNMKPEKEMRHRGLSGLKDNEIQDYLRIMGKYDPETDSLGNFWLPSRN